MTDDELKAIEARAEAATKGQWTEGVCPDQDDKFLVAEVRAPGREIVFYTEGCFSEEQDKANARLAAHSRADIPDLCAEVRRLRQKLEDSDSAQVLSDSQDERLLSTAVKGNK